MWTVISVCIVTVLAIYGITELLKQAWTRLLKPKGSPPAFFTLILKDDIFKEQLRFAEEFISWEGENIFSGILVIDAFLSEENKIKLGEILKFKHNVVSVTGLEPVTLK